MKLDTITMDKAQAREAYMAYRAAVRAKGAPEDEMLARGYRALALGRSLISLPDAMKLAGLRNDGYPACAIARADATEVRLILRSDGAAAFRCGRGRKDESFDFHLAGRLPDALEDARKNGITYKTVEARTIVPNVPAKLRPDGALAGYHIFWEVEEWKPVPPKDPALLKHIGGDLWAVMAVWDLTPLERAVIAGTRAR